MKCTCEGDYNFYGTAVVRHPNYNCPVHGELDSDAEIFRLAQVLATERYNGARLMELADRDRNDLLRQAVVDFASGKRY